MTNQTVYEIVGTTQKDLDGVLVTQEGIVADFRPAPGSVWIISRCDEKMFSNGYRCIPMPEACLRKV